MWFPTCPQHALRTPNCRHFGDASHNFLRLLHQKASVKRITPLKNACNLWQCFHKNSLHVNTFTQSPNNNKRGVASFPTQPLPRPDFTFTQGGMSSNYSEAHMDHDIGSLSILSWSRFGDDSHFTYAQSSTFRRAPGQEKSLTPDGVRLPSFASKTLVHN